MALFYMHQADYSLRLIGQRLGRSHSTVSEIKT
ncbi:MAG: helix-turn-helix domain-containing protein [Thiotrichales bacterium]|nr:helix-turn-helix domain-containing protein [Thiotrichales bacterium]